MANFTPLSKFYLIKDVDIDISYSHEYYFENETAQNTFFMSKVFKTVENGTYQRKNSNVIAVPFLADDIRECKYLAWKNDVSNKWYYAFVTSVSYVNPNVSNIEYQLDVYQTYLFDLEWKESFVERKHCKQYEADGSPVINDSPENLDYGNSYRTIKKVNLVQIPDVSYVVMAFSEPIDDSYDIGIISQNVQGIPTNLWYYIFPIYVGTEKAETVYFSVNGVLEELTTAKTFMAQCMLRKSLVGKMVSCVIVPFLTFGEMGYGYTNNDNNIFIRCDNLERVHARADSGGNVYSFLRVKQNLGRKLQPYEVHDTSTFNFGDFYELGYTESKLYQYPYSFTELTTERGDTFIIRNEYMKNPQICVQIFGTLNFQNKMSFVVKDYLNVGTYMENGVHDNSNASLPIIDDYTASYLQSNSNSIAVARSNALASLNTELANAERTATTSATANATTGKGTIGTVLTDVIGGVAGTLLTGNIGSTISGLVRGATTTFGGYSNYVNTGEQIETSKANTYASANTNYANSVATVLAKYQDAQQVPSTVRSMGGDYLYDIAYYCDGIYLLKKSIMPEVAERLQNYFKQYGYAYNKVELPEFHTRTSWNYIRLTEPNVSGNIPMDDLLAIRDIFMKGITLWHGDYIGDYTRSNAERRA